jgi:integrase
LNPRPWDYDSLQGGYRGISRVSFHNCKQLIKSGKLPFCEATLKPLITPLNISICYPICYPTERIPMLRGVRGNKMPTVKLTALSVANAKPPAKGRVEYFDAALPGFALRVTHTGTKSWTLLYRPAGQDKLRRLTLGAYPALSLADARGLAREAIHEADAGADPAAEKTAERQHNIASLFENVAAEFIARHCRPRNRGWHRQERDLQREFLPAWRGRPIGSIARLDIIKELDRIADRSSPRRANRYLALIKKLFSWAAERGYVEASAAAVVKPPGREVSRDRVLADAELAAVWRCCEQAGWPFGDLFRLLAVTGQRLGEVAAMRWENIDLSARIWTVPAELSKNSIANEVPISDLAFEILERLSPLAGHSSGYVFPAMNGSSNPVSGFSRAKANLDKALSAGVDFAPWRLHDLRRTAASGMARLGVAPHVIERLLNHMQPGVAGVYNRFGYLPEKRTALDLWAAHIRQTIDLPSNMIHLRAQSGAISANAKLNHDYK